MKNTNTLTLTHDELARIVANAVANALTQAQAQAPALASAPTPAPVQAHTPVQASTPAPTQARTYEHVDAGFDNFVVKADKKVVQAFTLNAYTYTSTGGNVCKVKAGESLAFGRKDVWGAFKARMRKAGGAYDAQAKVWAFPSAKAAKTFAEGEGAKPFTADEINAVLDNWTRKAEKRANKAE